VILACIWEKMLRGCQLENYEMGGACDTHEVKCVYISMFKKKPKDNEQYIIWIQWRQWEDNIKVDLKGNMVRGRELVLNGLRRVLWRSRK